MNRIINRVLVEMDGFDAMDNVVVVAATNHEDNIDEALRRPGRFDMLVRLSKPTLPERQALFALYLGKTRHDGRADCATLARMSSGMSPAEIANVVNKAASTAAEQGADSVTPEPSGVEYGPPALAVAASMVMLQPPPMSPMSPPASSTTYRLHVPLGEVPSRVERVAPYGPAGAGAGRASGISSSNCDGL